MIMNNENVYHRVGDKEKVKYSIKINTEENDVTGLQTMIVTEKEDDDYELQCADMREAENLALNILDIKRAYYDHSVVKDMEKDNLETVKKYDELMLYVKDILFKVDNNISRIDCAIDDLRNLYLRFSE